MTLLRTLPLALSIAAAFGAAAAAAGPVTAQAQAAPPGRPGRTASRRLTGSPAQLTAVAAIPGSAGAWAVGERCAAPAPCPGAGPALALRWRAGRWRRVRMPSPGGPVSISAVSASSRSDAWVVGSYDGSTDKNLFLHWNGRAWQHVLGPSEADGTLTGVAAVSRDDAWAVGYYQNAMLAPRTLVLHWNGRRWRRVASPDPGASQDELLAVSAVSGRDAWAVGLDQATGASTYHTLILRWTGRAWARVASPPTASTTTQLAGVAAVSPSDAWAVGQYDNPNDFDNPLILHWNGSSWHRSKVSGPARNLEELSAVAAASATDAWAVGTGPCAVPSDPCPAHSLILRWNGTAWTRISSPSIADHRDQNGLAGVAAAGRSDAWAAGSYYPVPGEFPVRALLLHWTGTRWASQ